MTSNDLRVIENIERSTIEWDGYAPHGAPDWVAIRRLEKAGIVQCIGVGECGTCDEPHEVGIYTLTNKAQEVGR